MTDTPAARHDPALIEAMARAICCPNNPSCKCSSMSLAWRSEATAALTALCQAHPGVAAVLRGEAVAVPREATFAMLNAAPGRVNQGQEESMYHGIYRAMLAASPWAKEGGG